MVLAGCLTPDGRPPSAQIPSYVATADSETSVVVAIRASDCLTCSLFDGFAALRQAQLTERAGPRVDILVAVVSDNAADTLQVRRVLLRERLVAHLKVVAPRAARHLPGTALPTIYLVQGRRILRQWSAPRSGAAIVVGRSEIIDALRYADDAPL